LIKHPVFDQVTASRLATLSPYSVSPNDDLGKALTIMRDNHVRKLAVTDARGLPVGLIKLEDLAGDILAKMDTGPDKYFRMGKDAQSISKPSPMSMKVAGIMEDLPVIVDPEARMRDVLKQMAKQNNPAVLVKHNMLIATQDVYNYYLAALLPQTLPIAISHLPDVDGIDQGFIEQTLERTFQKLMRVLKSDHHLHAVYKQVQKSGLRARTNVRLSLEGAGRSYHAEATDWKVRLATVEACKTIEKEVLRAFRSNSSRKNRAV
ncbi:MAG: CBS domain-containing protein, partial [archaeon]|nr:CBS domain-containing protein [archaeon]